MGATYHVAYPVIVRSTFGMIGSYPAIVIRAFVAMMWTAIFCVQAGAFLQNCIEVIWPSFKKFPNHLSEGAGIDCRSFCAARTVHDGGDSNCTFA